MVCVRRYRPRPPTDGAIVGRFCVMTMSVEELVIGHLVRPALRAGDAMIHLNDLLHGQEEQSTPSTSSILGFRQVADPPPDLGMCLEPFGPIQQVPIVGARGALHL